MFVLEIFQVFFSENPPKAPCTNPPRVPFGSLPEVFFLLAILPAVPAEILLVISSFWRILDSSCRLLLEGSQDEFFGRI